MAQAVGELFPDRVTGALVAGPAAPKPVPLPDHWRIYRPAHPFPDAESVEAGVHALRLAESRARDGRLVLLLSGGASSMLCVPAHGVALEDKVAASRALMAAAVPIADLNCVRKHLSAIKGGQLGAAAGRALTVAISDVHHPVPDDPAVIGSGPAVGDPTTFAQALEIAGHVRGIPRAVLRRLEAGAAGGLPETIKPQDPRLRESEFVLLGNRLTAIEGAARSAAARGYEVAVMADVTQGEARDAARDFVTRAERLSRTAPRPLCVLAAGETTVRVVGAGKGGRNQEFALSAAPDLKSLGGAAVLASVGTDGFDGPTDAAGALADSTTMARARDARLDRARALEGNDAYPFFARLDDLIISGPTGTNVGDLQILLIA